MKNKRITSILISRNSVVYISYSNGDLITRLYKSLTSSTLQRFNTLMLRYEIFVTFTRTGTLVNIHNYAEE